VQDGLLAPIVPLERYAGPVYFGDGAKIILVATPADAGTDVQQPGLEASHSLAVSLRFYQGAITLAAWRADCHAGYGRCRPNHPKPERRHAKISAHVAEHHLRPTLIGA
jgi:hypothetical protein